MKLTIFRTAITLLAVITLGNSRAFAAEAYVIADSKTGHILESSKPDQKLQVASLTKIATALVVLDWADATGNDLDQSASIIPSAAASSGVNAVGFAPGDRATLRDLLYAALLQSDNIAAEALAMHVGNTLQGDGSPVDRFVAQMNALARQLGMEHTRFLNPHGLETEKKLPYSTAGDMTTLARRAMDSSAFRFLVSQPERKISVTRADGTATQYLLRNTNELLGKAGIDGVKTGMTKRAGGCLIVSAARDPLSVQTPEGVSVTPRRLVVTVLGSQNRFAEAESLLARGWQLYEEWSAAGRPTAKRR